MPRPLPAPTRCPGISRILSKKAAFWCAVLFAGLQPPALGAAPDSNPPAEQSQTLLQLLPNDRVVILGGATADAMLQDGYLEALFLARYPGEQLAFRSLAFPGAVLDSDPERSKVRAQWLQTVHPSVIMIWVGEMESQAGEKGIAKFKADLAALVRQMTAPGTTSKQTARLVLVGPKALDPTAQESAVPNQNRKLYSEAISSLAKEASVPFVDLFTLSAALLKTNAQRSALLKSRWGMPSNALVTATGYLTEEAHRILAPDIFKSLAGTPAQDSEQLSELRAAIVQKNAVWRARYRKFAGSTPLETAIDQIEKPVAELDRVIWDIAQHKSPAPINESVKAAPHSPSPGVSHSSSDIQPSVAPDFQLTSFADSTQFPELQNPVQIEATDRGRLLVLCRTPSRPNTFAPISDRLLLLEDTDGDGRADKCSVYADQLNLTGAFAFYRDGVVLEQAGDLWLLRDPLHTGRATVRERILMGLGTSETSGLPNRLTIDPMGAILWSDPSPHVSRLETSEGMLPPLRGAIYRLESVSGRVEPILESGLSEAPVSIINEWGRFWFMDRMGKYWRNGTSVYGRLAQTTSGSNSHEFPAQLKAPIAGTAFLNSTNSASGPFDALLVSCNSPTPLIQRLNLQTGKLDAVVSFKDSPGRTQNTGALTSAENGSVYFIQASLERSSLYKLTHTSAGSLKTTTAEANELDKLLANLQSPDAATRRIAKHKLATRPPQAVVQVLKGWLEALDPKDDRFERNRLEALWLESWLNHLDPNLLQALLNSSNPSVRSQAVHVLSESHPASPDALRLLTERARDSEEQVRMEVLAACNKLGRSDRSRFQTVVHSVLEKPFSEPLGLLARDTLLRLEPDASKIVIPAHPVVASFVLQQLSDAELLKAPPTEFVWQAQMDRTNIPQTAQLRAIEGLAKIHGTTIAEELARTLERSEVVPSRPQRSDLIQLLLARPVEEFSRATAGLARAAATLNPGYARKAVHAAWVQAGSPSMIWSSAKQDNPRKIEFLESLVLVRDASARAGWRRIITDVLQGHPKEDLSLVNAAIAALPWTGVTFATENLYILESLISSGVAVPSSARALFQLPEAVLTGAKLGSLVEALSQWLDSVPEKDRSSLEFDQTADITKQLAIHWEKQANEINEKLKHRASKIMVVRAVFDQDRFDRDEIKVTAGDQVKLLFENAGGQSQNFVLIKSGSRAAIIHEASRLGHSAVDSQDRLYVPNSPDIVAATRVLYPGESQLLEFKAPERSGAYEYICTIPGRPETLRGRLIVEAP